MEQLENSPSPHFSNLDQNTYAGEASFALVATALIFNIILIVKMNYGDMIITRISALPYKISLMIFLLSLIDYTIQLYIYNVHCLGDALLYTRFILKNEWYSTFEVSA